MVNSIFAESFGPAVEILVILLLSWNSAACWYARAFYTSSPCGYALAGRLVVYIVHSGGAMPSAVQRRIVVDRSGPTRYPHFSGRLTVEFERLGYGRFAVALTSPLPCLYIYFLYFGIALPLPCLTRSCFKFCNQPSTENQKA
jgi:hypothetical protein